MIFNRGQKHAIKIAFILMAFAVVFIFFSSSVSAATLEVGPGQTYSNITSAVNAAGTNDIVNLHANPGGYTENVVVSKSNLTIQANTGDTVNVQATGNNKVFSINSANYVTIQGLNLQSDNTAGSYGFYLNNANFCNIQYNNLNTFYAGIYSTGSNNNISNNHISNTIYGMLQNYPSNNNLISGNTISNPSYNPDSQTRMGINSAGGNYLLGQYNLGNQYINNNISGVNSGIYMTRSCNYTFTGNHITIKDTYNYAWALLLDTGPLTNQFNRVNNNILTSEGKVNAGSRGIYLISNPSSPSSTNLQIYSNSFTNFTDGIIGILYTPTGTSTTDIYLNRFYNNTHGLGLNNINPYYPYTVYNITVNAINNWWGKNSGLVVSNGSSAPASYDIWWNAGTVNYNPWIVLTASSNPSIIPVGGTSTITTDLTKNSNAQDTTIIYPGKYVPNGIPVNFSSDALGGVNPLSSTINNGKATTTFTAGNTGGISTVTVKVDGMDASAPDKTVATTVNIISGVLNTRTGLVYATIQTAVDAVLTINGDTLLASTGTYNENVLVNKNLIIQALGAATVHALDSNLPTFTINSAGNGSTIQGFNITGATKAFGIYLNSANNCHITSNTIMSNFMGIYAQNSNGNTISGNTVQSNGWNGICLDNSSSNTVNNGNVITGNVEGIYIVNTSNGNTITGNNIHNNADTGITILNTPTGNNITGNNATSNNGVIGILIRDANSNSISTNTIQGNGWAGIVIDHATGNVINNINNISGNIEGIQLTNTATGNIIQANNITGNTDIGVSIIINSSGNTITGNTAISQNNVMGIYIRDSNNNILSGNVVSTNGWLGVCLDNSTKNTINTSNNIYGNLEGLYIVNNSNNNNIQGNNIRNNNDTGIYVNNSSITISSNIITGNAVVGILLRQANGNNITGNTISNIPWTGIALDQSSTNIISGNNVSVCQMGIYITNNSSGNSVTLNTLHDNTWAGLVLDQAANTSVHQNNFVNNLLQALAQNGTGNTFYQNTTGNYWSDWNSTNPRPINGNENLFDNYPSTTPF